MSKRILLAALCALTLGIAPSARADGPADSAELAVADSIGQLRAEQHVSTLRRNADLDEAALLHAEDMASHHFVGHESPRSGDPAARVRSVGARVSRVGENVARAATTEEALAGLASSDAHRAQIIAPEYTDFGVAVVEGEDGFYVVEVFATRSSTDALPPPAVADVPVDPEVDEPVPAVPDASYAALDQAIAVPNGYAQPIAPDPGSSQPPMAPQAAPYAPYAPVAPSAMPMPPTQPGVMAAPSYAAYGPQYGGTAAPASNPPGAPYVTLQVAPPTNVQGYWVYYSARWWYFPIPAGARPGQVLAVSTTVTGTPPGVANGYAPTNYARGPNVPNAYAPPVPPPTRFGLRPSSRRW